MNEDTRRAVIEKAYDAQMVPETPEPEEAAPVVEAAPEPEIEAPPKAVDDRPRDEQGRFLKTDDKPERVPDKPSEKVGDKVKSPAPEQTVQNLTAADTQKAPEPPKVESKAPVYVKGLDREDWEKTPQSIRDLMIKRDREVDIALRETTESRQNWGRFKEMFRPYESILAMNGGTDPVQSAATLFQTAALLQMGNEHQKAMTAAQIIAQYAINPELIGAYLSGEQQAPQEQAPQEFRDPRMDALIARLDEARQRSAEAQEARMSREIEQFAATAPYFEDVRESMADIIEIWSKQGKVDDSNLTQVIQKAYDRAVQMDERVASVEKQRRSAQAVQAAQQKVERSRAAASSIKPQASVAPQAPPKDRREALQRALDEQLNRGA